MMELQNALKELAGKIKDEIISRLHSNVGINRRTGTNTLIGSDLETSIDVKPVNDNTLVFQIADYFMYVVRGWERTEKGDGTFREYLLNINEWIGRKDIQWKKPNGENMTQNQMVWALANAMFDFSKEKVKPPYKIPPRPFIAYDPNNDTMPNYKVTLNSDIDKILPFIDDFFDKWSDSVFERIMADTDKFFNS